MRADRLIAALLLMQARGRVTAAELATELEVSVATARRDLEALSAAGIPVYPQAGRNGGWQLLGGARTDLSGLTATEARALFLLIGPAAADAPVARAALRKLLGALPATFRADAQAAAAAVIVDPVGWGEHGREPAAMVEVLRAAVVDRRKVRLVYEGRGGTRSERLVDPLGLADAWEQVVDEVERRRAQTAATATIPTRFVEILRAQLGRHCEVDGPAGDDRTRVRVTAPTARDIARHLAGWGSLVAVEKPPAVRAELARIGAELTAANSDG